MDSKLTVVACNLDNYRKFYERTPVTERLLFNSPEFLSYKNPNPLAFLDWRTKDASFAQSACWVAVGANSQRTIVIPGGASFGGPIAHRHLRLDDYANLFHALIDYSHLAGYTRIEWTPSMPHHGATGDEEAEFAALQLGFQSQISGLESVVTLPAVHDSKFQNLLRKCRREGLTYIDDVELDSFYTALEAVYSRHNTHPTHSKHELAVLKHRFPKAIRFVGVLKGSELAATACLFRISPTADLVFYMCTIDKHKKDNPMMLLISEDMIASTRAGCLFYNFGTSSVGLELRENVLNFKQQFGARGFMRRKLVFNLREEP